MTNIKEIFNVWKTIFTNLNYILLTIFIGFIFYIFNVMITNIVNIKSFYSILNFYNYIIFLISLLTNFKEVISLSSFIFIIIMGFLFGIFISLLIFKSKSKIKVNKKSSFIGGFAISLGILVPGCAACGIGLVSLLGFGAGFLSFFPYDGLELSILSILVLCFTMFKISKDLTICEVCKIDLKKIKMKGGRKNGRKKN